MRRALPNLPSRPLIAYYQASEKRVNEIDQRLRDDGFDVTPPARCTARGGFTIEVLC